MYPESQISLKKLNFGLHHQNNILATRKYKQIATIKKPSFEFFADANCPFEQNGDTIQNYMKKSRFAASN